MSVELTLGKWNTHRVGGSVTVLITYLDTQMQLLSFDALWLNIYIKWCMRLLNEPVLDSRPIVHSTLNMLNMTHMT